MYLKGYDGHSLRAYYYWPNEFPDIDPEDPESINSIKGIGAFRQDSKPVTFALTYQGTAYTLVANCGFSLKEAEAIYENYHKLYEVSTQWVNEKLELASKTGYVELAFGLRLRTPILERATLGMRSTPKAAAAEGRTAGNALGQSYGLLNNRSCSEFMYKVRLSEYRLDIRVAAQIHDAQYYYVRDNIDIVAWVNEHLVKAVKWQELDDIKHDEVKLGGDLSLFYPTWADEIVIPNGANAEEILQLCIDTDNKRNAIE